MSIFLFLAIWYLVGYFAAWLQAKYVIKEQRAPQVLFLLMPFMVIPLFIYLLTHGVFSFKIKVFPGIEK